METKQKSPLDIEAGVYKFHISFRIPLYKREALTISLATHLYIPEYDGTMTVYKNSIFFIEPGKLFYPQFSSLDYLFLLTDFFTGKVVLAGISSGFFSDATCKKLNL